MTTNPRYSFSVLLDIVIECTVEDPDQPGPTTMNIEVSTPERRTGETLTLEKISSLEWRHNNTIKL